MEKTQREDVTLRARVLRVCGDGLLVCDLNAAQEVRVHTAGACRFQVGDCVCIRYSGAMTMSIPPQISADSICRMNSSC